LKNKGMIVAGMLALGAGMAQAQVVNGGFEDPDLGFMSVGPGQTYGSWTCDGPNGIEFVEAVPSGQLPGLEFSAYEGSYWVDLTGVGAPSGIHQDVVTTVGQAYEVSFAMAGNPWSGSQLMRMEVLWNGTVVGTFEHDTTGHSGADMGWTLRDVTVVGTGTDRLAFRALSGATSAGPALDAVSMRPIPSAATLVPFAGAMLTAMRRRR
jgi:hypothetical protein